MAYGSGRTYPSSHMTVGERILERRLELRLPQRRLAEGSGFTASYISHLEQNARQPSVKVLRRIAPILGVSAHWLETGRDDPAEELALLVLSTVPEDSLLADLALEVLHEREWVTRQRSLDGLTAPVRNRAPAVHVVAPGRSAARPRRRVGSSWLLRG